MKAFRLEIDQRDRFYRRLLQSDVSEEVRKFSVDAYFLIISILNAKVVIATEKSYLISGQNSVL